MKNIKLSYNSINFILFLFPFITLLVHLYCNAFSNYGIFRDELYYIACSKRLAMGYVDQPPLSLYILAVFRFLFSDSLFVLRLFPAIAASLTVYIAGLITLRMGGNKLAVLIACIAVFAAPIYWAMFTFYSMNTFDILLWTLGYYVLILLIQSGNKKYWILLGLIIGFGALNKISFLWFGAGLFFGLIFTENRKQLLTVHPYFAALIALVLFSPFIIWNVTHNFAHLEFIKNASNWKYSSLTPVSFIIGLILDLNPIALPIWLLGIYYLMFSKNGERCRFAGYIYVVTFIILMINWHSKSEYMAPASILLFAAGGVQIERIVQIRHYVWLKYAVPIILIITGIAFMPFALPIMPVDKYLTYAEIMGQKPSTSENKELSELPQFYADMFGWEGLAKTVSGVYKTLPAYEKPYTVAFASNYGDAGSIEYYSSKYPLPMVVSPHNNYWLWGKDYINNPSCSPKVFLVLGGDEKDLSNYFEEVQKAAVFKSRFIMPYENNKIIFVCRKIKTPLKQIWLKLKNFS